MHVVTVNDYLARRDSEWVGQVHKFLGLEVGLVQQVSRPRARHFVNSVGCALGRQRQEGQAAPGGPGAADDYQLKD